MFHSWQQRLQAVLLASSLALTGGSVLAQSLPNATVYKSATCGCCEEYVKYLRQHGVKVQTINHSDMNQVRQQLGTARAASCHTVKIGSYVVEGHVPIQAIRKMVAEKPNIKGIALPGMPYNSPGMGPEKKGSLKIMSINKQGLVGGVYSVL